jgi:hypothetical protein
MQPAPADEISRVQEHLSGALALAAMRSERALDPAQRLTRALLLEELISYRDAGIFPKNRDFIGERRPYFVDGDGTPCAMAHLMSLGGANELVAEIARTRNNAYVEELAVDDRFVSWLRAAGLTLEEAARIQPSYCPSAAECMCILATRYDVPNAGVVWEGTVVPEPDGGFGAEARIGRVDTIHTGDPGDAGGVGDERIILIGAPLGTGQRFLALDSYAVVTVEDGGGLGTTCLAGDIYPALPPFTREKAIALAGSDFYACSERLVKEHPAWAAARCSEERGNRPVGDASAGSEPGPTMPTAESDDAGGCSLASSSPESLSMLLAVVTTLALRRRRRGRRGS